jgi:hypothetical protein
MNGQIWSGTMVEKIRIKSPLERVQTATRVKRIERRAEDGFGKQLGRHLKPDKDAEDEDSGQSRVGPPDEEPAAPAADAEENDADGSDSPKTSGRHIDIRV